MVARAGLAPAPTVPRQFQLGQFSPAPLCRPRRDGNLPRFASSGRADVREPPMRLAFATPADLGAILGLIEDASRWLKAQGKDQWAEPWPNREQRDEGSSWDWSTGRR